MNAHLPIELKRSVREGTRRHCIELQVADSVGRQVALT